MIVYSVTYLLSVNACVCVAVSLKIYEQAAQMQTSNQPLMRDPVLKFMPRTNERFCSVTQPDTESVEIPLGCWQTVVRGLRLMRESLSQPILRAEANAAHPPPGFCGLYVVRRLKCWSLKIHVEHFENRTFIKELRLQCCPDFSWSLIYTMSWIIVQQKICC